MDKNKKRNLIILSIVLLIVLTISGVYAWLTFTTGNVIIAGNTHCFTINYSKGADITGNIGAIKEENYVTGNTIKLSTAMGFTPISLELDKSCNKVSGIATVELNVESLGTAFTDEGNSYGSLKYVVAEYNPKLYTDSTIQYLKNRTFTYIRRGVISELGTMDIHTEYLSPGEKHNYLIIVYIDKNKVGDDILEASISATATARAEQFVATPLSDFTYATGTYNGITIPEGSVLLVSYDGTDTVVNVPATYTINGTTYTTIVYGDGPNDESTFYGNTTITEVNFADGVLFADLNNEESFTFDSADRLFKGCTSLVSAPKLPNTITNLDNTYDGCTSLTNVRYIPTSVNTMLGTFKNCSSLEGYIRVVGTDVTVDSDTFSGTSEDIIVEVPANSTTYDNITAVAPNNVEVVQMGLVDLSTPYTDFIYILGSDQTTITTLSSTFINGKTMETTQLENITLDDPITIESDDILLVRYIGESTSVTIPATYTINGNTYNVILLSSMYYNVYDSGIFCYNADIEEVYLDPDIDTISLGKGWESGWAELLFYNCSSLTTVSVIPNSITNMSGAFDGCESLEGTIRFGFCSGEQFSMIGSSNIFDITENQIVLEFPENSDMDSEFEDLSSYLEEEHSNFSASIYESNICPTS